MAEVPQRHLYTREDVCRVLAISERQLSTWERQDLIPHTEVFAFSDLIALRKLSQLRKERVPHGQIRKAVAAIREREQVDNPLSESRLFSDSGRMRAHVAGQTMEPVSGQFFLGFDAPEGQRLVNFPGSSPAEAVRQLQKQRLEAEHWFLQAVEMEQRGAPADEVIAAYRKAADLDPSSSGPLVNLGTIYFNARQWREAETYYRKALEVNPEYPLAHFNLGNLFDERGNLNQAVEHYSRAIELKPQYADAHYNLALVLQSMGHTLRAIAHWQTFLRLDPSGSWAVIARRELDKLRRAMVVDGKR